MAKKPTRPQNHNPKVERVNEQPSQHMRVISQSFDGPLPAPHILADYDKVHPGLAGIIVESFQKETAHRHAMESLALETDAHLAKAFADERKRGQRFGLIIAIALVCGAVTLGYLEKQWAAVALGGAGFASIVGAFVMGRQGAPDKKPNK